MKVPPRLYRGVQAVMERLPRGPRDAVAREAWVQYRRAHTLQHRLDYLFWETTLRCNLQCAHCGSSCSPEPLPGELTTAEIDDALAGIARRQDPKTIMLVASGGEPLVREDLLEVMGRAARRGYRWGMVTNGLLVNDEMVDRLARAGMRTVSVSVDGTEEHHDGVRLREGSYRKALRALEALQACPYFSIVEILTTLNRHNAGDLEHVLELALRLGVKAWRVGTVAPIGRAKDQPELWVTGEQLRAAMAFVQRHRGRHPGLDLSYACEGYTGERFEPHVRKHRFACWAGIRVGGILADGAVSACPDIPRHFVQGNIRDRDFMDLWEQEFQPFRDRRWMQVGDCAGCKQWRICGGGGLHYFDPERGELQRCHARLMGEL